MGSTHTPTEEPARRKFFSRVIATIQTAIAATLGVVAGGSVLSPSFNRREGNWLPTASSLSGLTDDVPAVATLRVAREDGYSQVVERRVVLLVKTGEGQVTALDPTCTHLGCRVSWNAESKELRCPCHGGVFDHLGMVKSGPPPGPLPRLATRIEGDQILIQV
jgi:Rieske Fe-S protein